MPSSLVLPEDRANRAASPRIRESAAQGVAGTIFAVEHIRRMRGGSQAHLMRCSDNNYYVVKFRDNPQGTRTLVNEYLGTRLAASLGLPVPSSEIVVVSEELIRCSEEMVFELANGRTQCPPGLCFGSRYPADPRQVQMFDLLPESLFCDLENISDFWGMLVFDKWTCNTDGRQAIFMRKEQSPAFQAAMIDQGMCFNCCEWNFPDAPLRGLYYQRSVYEQVRGMDDFEPWLATLESEFSAEVLIDIAKGIPPEWYESDCSAIERLLDQLDLRRGKVRELLWSTWNSCRDVFPNWIKSGQKDLVQATSHSVR